MRPELFGCDEASGNAIADGPDDVPEMFVRICEIIRS
jgi:hypothetical protein